MTDAPRDPVLEMVSAIRLDIAEVRADLVEVKERLGLIEGQYASLSRRMDRLGGDMEQVRRRLA